MTRPVDITDPTIARAYAQPLRIAIMGLLDNRVASPKEIAAELGAPLSNTSYHVRQLASIGWLELVNRRLRRGAVQHYYTAAVRPTIYDKTWAETPAIVKQAIVGGKITQTGTEVVAAAEAGGFNREDAHLTRTRKTLTREGWAIVSKKLLAMLDRLDRLADENAERLKADPDAKTIDTTVVMMLFESPPPTAFEAKPHDSPAQHDELQDDLAPPGAG